MVLEDRIKELFEEEGQNTVKITREAFKKMRLYAKFISEILGIDVECGGVLLNDRKKDDGIIRDVYLSDNQEVDTSEGKLKIGDCYSVARKNNKKICGMWHSHGVWNPFHSEWDDSQLKVMFFSNRENKKTISKRKCSSEINYEDGKLRISLGDKLITIKTDKKPDEVTTEQLIEKRYLDTIVINKNSYLNMDDVYYCERWIEGKKQNEIIKEKGIKIEFIDESNGALKNNTALIEECGGKVIYQGNKLKEHPNYKKVLESYSLETKTKQNYKQRLRKFYINYPVADELDYMIVNTAKFFAGDLKIRKKIKKHCNKLGYYAIIGALATSIFLLYNVEKISLAYLNKTRPDVVSMMKQGRPFSEVAQQFFYGGRCKANSNKD
ncbi:MAG: Mov34/MPN/PAD-1 family protein [Candidatus Nanoarchaeia archaeon]